MLSYFPSYYRPHRARSLSPEPLSSHVDSLIRTSRALSMDREELFSPSLQTSSIVCSALSPWSKSGAFYYPRYPESWRGTACTLPRTGYWIHPSSYYRHLAYSPRYSPRYVPRYSRLNTYRYQSIPSVIYIMVTLWPHYGHYGHTMATSLLHSAQTMTTH